MLSGSPAAERPFEPSPGPGGEAPVQAHYESTPKIGNDLVFADVVFPSSEKSALPLHPNSFYKNPALGDQIAPLQDAKEIKQMQQDRRDISDRVKSTLTGTGTGEGKQIRHVLSASSLTGDRVRNSGGEDLGTLKEIMIDLDSGRIAYGVLSVGGFMGMGDKLFAIPWSSFKVDEYNKELILSVDKETLESAPGFDKDNWPDFAEPSMGAQIYSHYGQRPYWDDSSSYGSETSETRREGFTRDTTGLHGDPSRDRSKF